MGKVDFKVLGFHNITYLSRIFERHSVTASVDLAVE